MARIGLVSERAVSSVVFWIARGLVLCSLGVVMAGFWMPWAYFTLRQPGLVKTFGDASGVEEPLKELTRNLGRVTLKMQRNGRTIVSDVPSLADIPTQLSGADILVMVRAQKTQGALALLELLTGQRHDLVRKSWSVYLIPGVAVLCGIVLLGWGRHPAASVGIGLLSAAIAAGGLWTLLTMHSRTSFVAITIGPGLWLSVGAYVGLSIASCLTMPTAISQLEEDAESR
jgi:hypothetical protein